MGDCEVVQLSERVLQRAQSGKKRSYRTPGETVGKEITSVAKTLERDAHAMALVAVTPVDATSPLP